MSFSKIIFILATCVIFTNVSIAIPLEPADIYRKMLVNPLTLSPSPEEPINHDMNSEMNSRVKTNLSTYEISLIKEINGKPFTAHQFLGFSGASYSDMKNFETEFKKQVINRYNETIKTHGLEAVTVLLMGGTIDGFGKGYEVINQLKKEGEIKNVIVAGMVSDGAVKYHVEGIEKGWGDVISPYQDIILLKKTYVDDFGNQSWELKSSPSSESDTAKVLKDLSRFENAGKMTFNVLGGGAQAFNETLELILEARNRPQPVEINLIIGFEPGKVKKDSGYRAADMLAYFLANNPSLVSKNIEINILNKNKRTSLTNHKKTLNYKFYEKSELIADSQLKELSVLEKTPENIAKANFYQTMIKLKDLSLEEISKFRTRSSEEITLARQKIKDLHFSFSNPTSYEAYMNRVDFCSNCLADSNNLAKIIKKHNVVISCEALF